MAGAWDDGRASRHRHAAGVRPTVTARFTDLAGARDAIKALENSGVDGDQIELLGRSADVARTPTNPKISDRRVARYLVPRVFRGAATGALIGAAIGTLIGSVVLTITGSATALLIACVLGGVFLGSTLGAFVFLERSIGLADDWSLTFQDAPEGPIWVGVYTQDPMVRTHAAHTLEHHRPLELRTDTPPRGGTNAHASDSARRHLS
jgi:hypothetical protein